MIEVDPRTRSSLYGLIGIILAAGWVAFGLIGHENQVFLTVMVVLSIVLTGAVTFLLRVRRPN